MIFFWFQGVHPCDRRNSITKYRELFPAIDFSLASLPNQVLCALLFFFFFTIISYSADLQVETDEDVLWKPEVREEDKDLAARGVKFMNW